MDVLPVFLVVRGRPVLLVGSGEAADAKRRLIEAAGGRVVTATKPGVQVAFVALDDAGEAAATAQRLRGLGMIVNVVDRPALCDFTVPAIVDRSPVVVAIGTGGASASLAKALRQRFEALLPPGLGALATAILAARDRLKVRLPDPADRRAALDAALAEGGALDPFGSPDPAAVERLLDGGAGAASETVTIRLTSDDPDDLTLGQARTLARADLLVHTADVPAAILARARRDAPRVVGDAAPPAAPGLTVIVGRETFRQS